MSVHCEWLQSLSTNKCPCNVNDYSLLVSTNCWYFVNTQLLLQSLCFVITQLLDISWTLIFLYNLDVSDLYVSWSPSYLYSLDFSWSPSCLYSLAASDTDILWSPILIPLFNVSQTCSEEPRPHRVPGESCRGTFPAIAQITRNSLELGL